MFPVSTPYPVFPDSNGLPLTTGYAWIGTANQNPETNPITVYWDAEGTLPAAQPLNIANGFAMRDGTPSRLYVAGDYSLTLRDRDGALIINQPVADNGIGLGVIVTNNLVDGILTADAPGRAKMADGYITLAKLLDGIFTADAAGRAKFAAAFVNTALLLDKNVTADKLADTLDLSSKTLTLPAGYTYTPMPVRQTVISGPLDSNGLAAFGGSTGGTTVAAGGTLMLSAANGFSSNGGVNRVGSITNPTWTGLSTNGTMYLYLDIAADGTCTPGATTNAPVYQWGGTYSTSSGQFTFNIQEMIGKVGNGTTAAQTYRVYVGEVTVAANVVSAISWYQLLGRYASPTQAFPGTNSTTDFAHKLGATPRKVRAYAVCTNATASWAVGDEIQIPTSNWSSGAYVMGGNGLTSNRTQIRVRVSNYGIVATRPSATAPLVITNSDFDIRVEAERGW